jgi:hypothetical protein
MTYLYSPPMPEWNALSNEDRQNITDKWDDDDRWGTTAWDGYGIIRRALQKREQRFLEATMKGPPIVEEMTKDGVPIHYRVRVPMRRKVINAPLA